MKTQHPLLSDWSMPEPVSSHPRNSTMEMSKNTNNLTSNMQSHSMNQDQANNNQGEKRWALPFLYGLLLGVLSNGLILAIIIALWLTSGNKTTLTTTTTAPIQLRWISTGITIIGTVGITGSASNQTNFPYGLAFDSLGALYVADYTSHRVQKITIGTSTGLTVAGQANAASGNDAYHLYQPVHMAFDSNNNMYVCDRGNSRVQFFTQGNLSGTTVVGITGINGTANNQLQYPSGIAYDSNTGNLYVADTKNHRVMQYQNGASFGNVVAGGNGDGLGTSQLSLPYGLYFDVFSNSLFIADFNAQRVVRWTLGDSNWTLVAGSASGVAGTDSASFNQSLGVTLDPMGNIYVADLSNHRIQLFLAGQSNGTTIAGVTSVSGTNATLLNRPYWVILDNQLNLYVSDTYNHRIQMFKRY